MRDFIGCGCGTGPFDGFLQFLILLMHSWTNSYENIGFGVPLYLMVA